MRKLLSIVTLIGATLLSTPGAHAHDAPGPVRIVAVLTLSGPWSYLGASELKGLQLGVEWLNRRGGLLGRAVELAYEDDGGDPNAAGDIARRLATPESADVLIGGSRSQTSIAIAAVAERARIPFIALGASSRISAQRRWVFQTSPNEGPAVRRVLADMKKRGIRRIALLSEDSEFGKSGRHEVQDTTHPQGLGIRTYGVRLGFDTVYQPTEASIDARLGALTRASDIDAIFVYGAGEGPVLVLRQLRRLGVKLPVYQSHGIAAYEFLRLAGDAAEGVRLASPPVLAADLLPADDPRKALLVEFVSAFHARFGELPSSFAGYAYDALMLGADAIRRATSADFESFRRAIELTQGLAGVTGTYRIWPDNHAGLDDKALLMLEVKDGAFRIAD